MLFCKTHKMNYQPIGSQQHNSPISHEWDYQTSVLVVKSQNVKWILLFLPDSDGSECKTPLLWPETEEDQEKTSYHGEVPVKASQVLL